MPAMTKSALFPAALLLAAALLIVTPPSALAETSVVTAQAASSDVELTGFTRARAVLPLVAEATGKVLEVRADVGDAIGPAGLFARVDPTFIELDLAENRVQQAKLTSRTAYDATEAARYRELVGRGSAAQAKLDELEQALDASRHELDALVVAERVLRERLERTRVAAPAGWLVTARSVEPGQWVTQGQTVGEAGDFRTLLVPFALTPEQLDALHAEEGPVVLKLPELSSEVPARIHRVNPGFDPATRKIAVELALDRGLAERRGGLRAVLTLHMPDPSGGVLLPREAVTERYEQHWVRREDGTEVKVVLLGNHGGPDGTLLRVAAPEVHPGDRFVAGGGE